MATTVPKADDTEPRTCTPTIRLSESEDRRVRAAAKRSGHKLATYMRLAVLAAVQDSEAASKRKRAG